MKDVKEYFLSSSPWLSLLVIAVGIALWRCIRRIVKNKLLGKNLKGAREGNIQLAFNVLKYVIALVALVLVLKINGINVSAVTAGLGIAGVVVGVALQDLLKDWIMGTSIVWDGYFSVGDVVRYKEYEGTVVKFNFKTTKIKDHNRGGIISISNRNISEIEVVSDWCDIEVPAPYDIPAEEMRAVMQKIAKRCAEIPAASSCEFVGTDKFAASQIIYRLRIHCDEDKKNQTHRDGLGIIQDVYAEEGIKIPFDRLDVHMN